MKTFSPAARQYKTETREYVREGVIFKPLLLVKFPIERYHVWIFLKCVGYEYISTKLEFLCVLGGTDFFSFFLLYISRRCTWFRDEISKEKCYYTSCWDVFSETMLMRCKKKRDFLVNRYHVTPTRFINKHLLLILRQRRRSTSASFLFTDRDWMTWINDITDNLSTLESTNPLCRSRFVTLI